MYIHTRPSEQKLVNKNSSNPNRHNYNSSRPFHAVSKRYINDSSGQVLKCHSHGEEPAKNSITYFLKKACFKTTTEYSKIST